MRRYSRGRPNCICRAPVSLSHSRGTNDACVSRSRYIAHHGFGPRATAAATKANVCAYEVPPQSGIRARTLYIPSSLFARVCVYTWGTRAWTHTHTCARDRGVARLIRSFCALRERERSICRRQRRTCVPGSSSRLLLLRSLVISARVCASLVPSLRRELLRGFVATCVYIYTYRWCV